MTVARDGNIITLLFGRGSFPASFKRCEKMRFDIQKSIITITGKAKEKAAIDRALAMLEEKIECFTQVVDESDPEFDNYEIVS